jgi:hypothetical protein
MLLLLLLCCLCADLAKQATDEELLTSHSQDHIDKVSTQSPTVCLPCQHSHAPCTAMPAQPCILHSHASTAMRLAQPCILRTP